MFGVLIMHGDMIIDKIMHYRLLYRDTIIDTTIDGTFIYEIYNTELNGWRSTMQKTTVMHAWPSSPAAQYY